MARVFHRAQSAARDRAAIDRQRLEAGLAEIGLQDEPVVPGAEDDARRRWWSCFFSTLSRVLGERSETPDPGAKFAKRGVGKVADSNPAAPRVPDFRSRCALARPGHESATPAAPSHHRPVALDADAQHLVADRASTSCSAEKISTSQWPRIAGGLDHGADRAQVDDAVAHHAAVEQQVGGRHQPVADVVGENALAPGARDLARRGRGPTRRDRRRPRRRRPRPARRRGRSACAERVHAGAVGGDTSDAAARSRAARRLRARRAGAPPMPSRTCRARAGEVLRALRQAADHEHEAVRAERGRLVDRAPVVVERRARARPRRRPETCRRGTGR